MIVKKTKYLIFERLPKHWRRKTFVYKIENRKTGIELATIQWLGKWRQYCLYPNKDTIWNSECLKSVIEFLSELKAGTIRASLRD